MGKRKKKAPIPPLMTLRVGPDRYDVFLGTNVESNGAPAMGFHSFNESQIIISTDYSKRKQRATLFHEALHAVDQIYLIGLTEEQVGRLEVGLLSLIDDNPQLLAFEGVQ